MTNYNDILESVAGELNLKEEEEKNTDELEDEEEILDGDDDDEIEDSELEEDNESEDEDELEESEEEEEKPDKLGVTGDELFGTQKVKVTKEEKQNYAFEQLRKKAREGEEELKRLEEIAKAYGFSTYKDMVDKLQKDAAEKKAKELGVDPKFYEDLQNTKRQLEQLQREREIEANQIKINTFVSRLNEFAKEFNLDDTDKAELINSLDEDGFTVDSLYKIKNYKKVFSGYLSEKILQKEEQKKLAQERKRKSLEEKRIESTGDDLGKLNIDALVEAAMKGRNLY